MRRWFLARFYRLWFGGSVGPPTVYVDKSAAPDTPTGDDQLVTIVVGDITLNSQVDP